MIININKDLPTVIPREFSDAFLPIFGNIRAIQIERIFNHIIKRFREEDVTQADIRGFEVSKDLLKFRFISTRLPLDGGLNDLCLDYVDKSYTEHRAYFDFPNN